MAKKILPLREKSSKDHPSRLDTSGTFTITNQLGLHARAAAQFVKIASRYQAEIKVLKDSCEVNGKSIMGILMLAASKGSVITIQGSGEDSKEAVRELGNLVNSKFGEA